MVNHQHLNHLKRGAKHWNRWRQNRLGMLLNLSGADLIYADLSKVNLREVDLSEVCLSRANLIHADLREANLSRAKLGEADLRGANLRGADLSGANLMEACLIFANLREVDLIEADLRGADLSDVDLIDANLSGARLSEADLSGAYLNGANLRQADLSQAYLSETNLSQAYLSEANLNEAYLGKTDLSGANLNEADLTEANLNGADLSGVNLRETDLSSVLLNETIFARNDLSTAKGLETIRHFGPSTVDVKSIVLPQGQALTAFLRGVGFSDTFIDYLPSLSQDAFQYYSVFISYSTRDDDFVKHLYADLQKKGVQCWFAPHNMKIGDKIRSRIDESIYLHDKLLLVLSRSSIQSIWVEKEVETAFDKERMHNYQVLFPIKLDEVITQTKIGWAGDIRRQRHIGDFTRWKDHDAYQQAFKRLLGDLKAE